MRLCKYLISTFGFLFFALSTSVLSQMVTMNPFDIPPPTLLGDVKALRAANPKMSAAELVDAANVLLAKEGVPFTFAFDDATCAAIDKSIKSLRNPPPRLNLRTKLRSVGGEPALLTLPPADFANNECGKCSITLPVLEIGEREFVALMLGRNIKFNLPANFAVAHASLLDEKDGSIIKTKWRLPFRTSPLGVTYDGNVIYLGFPDPELKDVSLAVFSEGVFQFATREEAESNGKGQLIQLDPKLQAAEPSNSLLVFDNRGVKQRVKFENACGK